MKLILHKDRIIKAGQQKEYLSKQKYKERPDNAIDETDKSWVIPAGSHAAARKDENHEEDDEKNAKEKADEAEQGQLAKLEQPNEQIKVPKATSTKQKPPEVTKQSILTGEGPKEKKLGWSVPDSAHEDVKQRNAEDEDQEASIEDIPIEDIDLPPPRDSGRTASVKEGMKAGAAMPPARGGYQPNGKFALDDGVHRINAAKEAGATHIPALTFKPRNAESKSKLATAKEFNRKYEDVAVILDRDGPGAFSAQDHAAIAHAARNAGADEIAKKHKKLADEAKAAESGKKMEAIVQAKGAGADKPKRGRPAKGEDSAAKKQAATQALEERKTKDFSQSIDKVSSYLEEMKSRVPEGSKEAKQIQEHLDVLANTKKEAPSTVGGYDVKAAYNLSAQIRNKVAASEDSKTKELADEIADRIDHETKLVEVASRVEKEIDNAVDPAKKKILEGHLKTLEAQMSNNGKLNPLDSKDLARAESDYYSISKQNIKDREALPEKERKKLDTDKKAKEKLKQQDERKKAAQAREQEKAKNTAERTAKQQAADTQKKVIAQQKLDQHKKDAGETRKQLLEHMSQNGKNIDGKTFQKLFEHYNNLGAHGNAQQLTPKEATELSRATADLNRSNKKVDASNRKQAAQQNTSNKKLVVQNTKNQEHKQSVKDTVNHIKNAMTALGGSHPMNAELQHHMDKILSHVPENGSFTKIQKKELMEAYSAASKAHRESFKPAKEAKEAKPEKKTFFSEGKASQTSNNSKVNVRSSAASGRAFGSKLSSATKKEEAAPVGDLAGDTALDGVTKLFDRKPGTKQSDSKISSKKEEVKDDTKPKVKKSLVYNENYEELDLANSLAKSIIPYNFLPGIESFQKHFGSKVSKLTGRVRGEYYSHLNDTLIKSIEGLDVG
jgi:hypothetical protein